MLQSMTGFGKAHYEDEELRIQVEVKSINSKYADITLQVPKSFADLIPTWKNLVTSYLQRGKIELTLQIGYRQEVINNAVINEVAFKTYYNKLVHLAQSVSAPLDDLFKLALQSPGVITLFTDKESLEVGVDHLVKQKIEQALHEALQACKIARTIEGKALFNNIQDYLKQIMDSFQAMEQLDNGRLDVFRDRLIDKLAALSNPRVLDSGRLEQELVYYFDKLDITEEKVRLKTHLAYFESTMVEEGLVAKKLGFIAQEINRELNTLGVKSNHASMQHHIIIMKNELEKIKEQLQNIL